MSTANRTDERGALLGWSLIGILAFLQGAALVAGLPGPGENAESPLGLILISLMFLLLGPLFLVAYFHPHKTFFFRGLVWFCEQFSFVRTRKLAFFFAVLCTLGGVLTLLQALATP